MESNNQDYRYDNVIQINEADSTRKFLANVFMWMFVALGVSAAFAYLFASTSLWQVMIDSSTHSISGLRILIIFAPLAFVLIMRYGINKISYPVLALLYIAYAAI